MTQILTILGNAELENRILAIATAQRMAATGQRVLLVSQDSGPLLGILLGCDLTGDRQELSPGLWVQPLRSTQLMAQSWDDLKALEAEYLRNPFFKSVYGQELAILPGMDSALALNALREMVASGDYDRIIFDGRNSVDTIRMFAMPEVMSWYVRRFRQVFLDSDLAQVALPFVQPLVAAVSTVNWSEQLLQEPTDRMTNILDQGIAAVADPEQVCAYLATGIHPGTIASSQHLWGMAQQGGLTVRGVMAHHSPHQTPPETLSAAFSPLPLTTIPLDAQRGDAAIDWAMVATKLSLVDSPTSVPQPLRVDVAQRQISLFLPGFDKKQVKLTQSGPELTIEAGDQRRNIYLPEALAGKPVAGAKFQDHYLIITIAP